MFPFPVERERELPLFILRSPFPVDGKLLLVEAESV